MHLSPTRRHFLVRAAQIGALTGLGDFAFLQGLPALAAEDVQVTPARVQFSPDIEPLVRLLEETPRARVLEAVVERIRRGTSYQELLAALLLAGVRNIMPRPVGFQFHAVLVINSAHLASLAAQDRDRWLPLLWAVDYFKTAQARHRQQHGDWVLPPVNDSRLPPAHQARQRFCTAMDNWDEEGADVAVAALVRTAGAHEVIELFWRYGARDFRDIGHKAIYTANAWRALQTIGWRQAEPVMRSLAFALLEHEGDNPARRDDERDRPGRENLSRLTRIRRNWQEGRPTPQAAADLLATLRRGSPAEASEHVVTLLNQGVAPASLWDGLFLGAGEWLMRQPGIVGLHCVTTINALHYAYQASGDDQTRRYVLLQAAAFLPMFRQLMASRGPLRDLRLDTLETEAPTTSGLDAVEEIFQEVSRDRLRAARKTLALLQRHPQAAEALLAAGRRLVFNKGNDPHDYKFSSAALEDYYHATPAWRNRFLASSLFQLRGAGDADNDLIHRARAALGQA
jgi:hypothetical protein